MPLCGCPTSTLTAVTFERGLALLRCGAHEEQVWTVDGQPISVADAHARLRVAFSDARSQTGRTGPRACGRVVNLHTQRPGATRTSRPATVDVSSMLGADERLTALLNAHGLHGSWSVA